MKKQKVSGKGRALLGRRGTISILPSKVGLFFAALIIFGIGIGFFISIADTTISQGIKGQPSAEQNILTYRILNTPSCFSYVDKDIEQVDAGLIDLSKFTQEQLDKCYVVAPSMTKKDCFKLSLYDFRFEEKRLISELQTKNFALCHAEKTLMKYPRLVRIYDNGDVRRGILFFESQKVK